jgi:hypothetical protein
MFIAQFYFVWALSPAEANYYLSFNFKFVLFKLMYHERFSPSIFPIDSINNDVSMVFNYLCTCDLYSPVHNVLEVCLYITWGSWRGLGPRIPEFFGPCEMGTSQ